MSISKEEAKILAESYVSGLDLRGYRYDFVGVTESEKMPGEWGVVFDVYTPNGHLMDGPVIFVVEKDGGHVRGFEPRAN